MANDYDLAGRVAIVTGGSAGIGAATARRLAAFGADVVIAARTLEDLERMSAAIEAETGRRCLPVQTDVKDPEQVVHMVGRTVDELGRVDILVNNAGGNRLVRLTDLPMRAWDSSFELNVRAAYVATREVGRHMVEQGSGAIVNVSSGAGMHGLRGGTHYASAKAALQMFTTVTAAEWGSHGVRANCVAVGLIASENALRGWKEAGVDPEASSANIPLRRPGTPDECASVIHFLVSEAASYVTGQTFAVNGGPSVSGLRDT
jgi:NAD(P)-dependent dehydrogenase (short-subunit alcohol dehydrogenase family)